MTTLQRTPGRVRVTAEEFGRMARADVFDGRHVELLDGELYEVTKNPPHDFAVGALARLLRALLSEDRHQVREEKSVEPWEAWWPEPDVAVVRGGEREYQARRPGPADIVLLAEVCDTSDQDRTKKRAGYAAAGIPAYWILDLNARCLEVHARPAGGRYPPARILAEGDSVALVIDGQVVGQIAVADMLPRE